MHTDIGSTLATLLAIAWLLPLVGFAVEIFGGYLWGRLSKTAAYLAVFCIGVGFVCSLSALIIWGQATGWAVLSAEPEHHAKAHQATPAAVAAADRPAVGSENVRGQNPESAAPAGEPAGRGDDHSADSASTAGADHTAAHSDEHGKPGPAAHAGDEGHDGSGHSGLVGHSRSTHPRAYSGVFYTLATFGDLVVTIDYYIDSLTLVMFVMVTFIATCIHIFAIGYMSDELTLDYVDHHAHTADGKHVHRPGRFYRFFAYMSLFCFSMLGLVLAGNIFQVFVFWELVGLCSYLLIGFYIERKSATDAANKAFIVNRVGDFGFIVGLMVIWTALGTFRFGETEVCGRMDPGIFQMVRGTDGQLLTVSDGSEVLLRTERDAHGNWQVASLASRQKTIPYLLLVLAGFGVFCGCIGKSAQFPLQTWLPDAMEGPTPVSALVHSATMVAAGVYLAGRFFPVFTTDVLLIIAYVGCITLFLAATIAIVATDIKRVLAYSTISQLGYMMLGIGVGGWGAGLFHLVTHAFFKSLLFLCSGSVIVGCHHEQDMTRMGGLLKKMPVTALTMLVGVIAISGLAIPGLLAFSGYHSKDAILATALAYTNHNPLHFPLFVFPLLTAGITAFYMFRLWFYTFCGEPRDAELHAHVHESPVVMTAPLIALAILAAFCAVGGENGVLYRLIWGSAPHGLAEGVPTSPGNGIALPSTHAIHEVHSRAGALGLLLAVAGTVLAYVIYVRRLVDPADIVRQFKRLHAFLLEKWQFDNVYDAVFVQPVHVVAGWCAAFDRVVLDGIIHASAKAAVRLSRWDRWFDEGFVDGLVNLLADVVYRFGATLRAVQTGRLRQYVVFLALGALALFVLLAAFFPGA